MQFHLEVRLYSGHNQNKDADTEVRALELV